MKKLLIIVFTFFASYILNAQVLLIDDFTLSATEGAYGVYTDMDCEVENVFYIDMQAPDASQHVQMRLLGKFLNSFVSSLRDAKEIYRSWSQIAKENHITFLSKDIKVSVPDKTLYFTDEGKWYLEHGVDLKCTFMVTQDGTCYLVLQSDDLTSSEAVAHGYSIGHFNLSSGRLN